MPSINREVITKLENGRREAVSTAELLILARALAIAPMLLIFPLTDEPITEVAPGNGMPAWEAVRWFYGRPRIFTQERFDVSIDDPIALFEDHDSEIELYMNTMAIGGSGANGMGFIEELAAICRDIRHTRATIRKLGLIPPRLPSELSGLADEDLPSNGDARPALVGL